MSFTVYKSSAGSGKTFTLVKEYIKLAIKKPDEFRHILAITFTNKAANEMKERVIKYLKELSAEPIDETTAAYKFLLPDIIESSNFTKKEISEKARMVLDSILHNYSDFAIGTIDSFVHRIIRTFAHDLKIPMNFEVEMDTDKLLSEAIDLLLNKAGSDELLTKALVEFTETKTDDEKSWLIEKDLQKFAKQLFKEDNLIHIDKIKKLSISDFLEIRKKLAAIISKFENDILKIAKDANELILKNNVSVESFYQGNKGIGKYFQNLANSNFEKIKPNTYVQDTVEQDKWYAGKATADVKTNIDTIKEELGNLFLAISHLRKKHYKHYVLNTLIFASIYPVTVLNEIEKIIDVIKKENNILPISEFNKRISKIVISQPVPFIYERLGEKYHNYLIDEFQDTSALQWMNLLPLIENSLSYNNFNMIVGDGKQAIYRWRGGDVEQFSMLPKLPPTLSDEFSIERAEALERNYEGKNLSSNFRSKAEVIDFNNKFFSHIESISSDYVKSVYDKCKQEFDAKNTGGYIEIDFLNNSDSDVKTYDEITLDKIAETITELTNEKFSYKDIAILCRSNVNASLIARHLISLGISVISDESLLITGSAEVNFLLALVSFISNPDDDIAKYRVIHYLLSNKLIFDNDTYLICKILRQNNSARNNSLNTALFLEYLQKNNFEIDVTLLSSLPIYELFENLISIFNIEKITDSYVRFFLDAVFEFSSGKTNSISDFLYWWDEQKLKRSIIIPDGVDAVKIMTIHKSKGLEFPVVIFPFSTKYTKSTNDNLWIDTNIEEIPNLKSALISNNALLEETDFSELYNSEKDKSLLDMLNVLYVALTRPSERLYVFTEAPSKKFAQPKSIPDFFASYLLSIGEWEENKMQYSFGNKTPRTCSKSDEQDLAGITLHTFSVKNRKQVIHLKKKSNDVWDVENPSRNSDWGNLVHYTLSKIKHSGEVENVISTLTKNGIILKQKEKELTEKIKAIISNPLLNPYFQPECEVKAETEILLKDGSTLRPDRVVIENKNAIVIDYKTGNISDSHNKQISMYAEILEIMGYAEVKKLLAYIDLGKVIEVN